ncbi:MAG: helix-turn-helix domain-containing protein [Elusimicrobia bacterium]|nr:helix-turn-helix domain-containing protein [Elusimicrobiota bacterium]
MTIAMLERKLKPLEVPVPNGILRWLYLHLPPQPMKNRKMHRDYSAGVRILMESNSTLDAGSKAAITQYLSAVLPFIAQYEKKEFAVASSTPEEVFQFLLVQNDLSQYDVAKELGGQPVVSEVLRGKRRLTREHIERLSKRFGVTPATFYPGGNAS